MDIDVSIKMYSEGGEETEGLGYCYTEIPTKDGVGVEIDLNKLMTYQGSDKLRIILKKIEDV